MRTLLLAAILVISAIPWAGGPPAAASDSPVILILGGQDEMKTRNPLPPLANDVWTRDVLDRAYDRPIKQLPNGTLLAYVAKGADVDQDGMFEPSTEYNAWREAGAASPLDVVVYYDFNGVYWHDGVQVTVWDLLFSYHLAAMHPQFNTSLRVLFAAGTQSTYEDGGRQLTVLPAAKSWEGEGSLAGNPALRAALRFQLREPYARFYEGTLAATLFPMPVWSRTGGGRHGNFGCAVWIPPAEASAKGLPDCGNADPAKWGRGIGPLEVVPNSRPYDFYAGEAWSPGDADVIGSGPFRFGSWIPGVEARVTRFEDYYVGGDTRGTADPADDVLVDPRLARMMKKPTIDGIRFKVYRTTQLGVFALQNGEIDFYHWNVGAEFVPDLLKIPEVAIVASAEPGFTLIGYNLRKAPFGYEGNDRSRDVGYWLRQAIAHLVDKKSIVQNRLQNFGFVLDGFISPANAFWYAEVPQQEYNLTLARAILDSPSARAAGIGPDPPGSCTKDTPSGCRALPGIGTSFFEILNPQTDYGYPPDPWSMVSEAMRQVGLNAVGVPSAPGEVLSRLQAHTFDMYVFSWRLSADPDYLFEMFHSSNAASGTNYDGFANATFDAYIEASRREMDRETRRQLVWSAHDVLVGARPAEPVYEGTNIEAYRQDRFVNWTVMDGTIWNEWSLLRIRPPPSETLRLSLLAPSAMGGNSTEPVTAIVLDEQGIAVLEATVDLAVDRGTLTLGGTTAGAVRGTTGADGRVTATYRSPEVSVAMDVRLSADAAHWDFLGTTSVETTIRIFPPGVAFLSVLVDLPVGDLLRPGGSLPMTLEVRDQDGATMPDAAVMIASEDEAKLRAVPSNGTAAELAVVSLTADASIADRVTLNVTVTATKTDHEGAEQSVALTVIPEARMVRCPTGEVVFDASDCPGAQTANLAPILLAVGFAVGVALVAGAITLWRRRRNG